MGTGRPAEAGWGRNVGPTRIIAECDNGVFTARVDEARGSLAAPMSAVEWRRKIEDCIDCGGFGADLADRFEATLAELAGSDDAAALLRQLSAGAA